MNWMYMGLIVFIFYVVWFSVLFFKKKYNRTLLFFALAHIPYLIINLVAPFRGVLDPNYAGYSIGWLDIPKGIGVSLVVGSLVLGCFFVATQAFKNRMDRYWIVALLLDGFLVTMVAVPLLLDVLGNFAAFTIELGEYLKLSGLWTAVIVMVVFTLPTLFAFYQSVKNVFYKRAVLSEKRA